MIGALLLLQQQGPDAHYAGGASSLTAGTTKLAGQFFRFLFSTVPQWVQLGGILIGVPIACILAWQAWKHRRRLWAWWVARPRPVQVSLSSAVFLVAAGGLGSGLYGYNYVMHENDFCQSCHILDVPWNRFQTTAHKKLECHACHRQSIVRRVSAQSAVRFVSFVRTTSRVRRRDASQRLALVSRVQRSPASDSTFLHSRHKSIECTQCHGTSSTHGGLKFTAPAGCIACHHGPQLRGRCSTCHSAASFRAAATPASNSSFQHSRHASVTCTQCHGTSGTRAALKFTSAASCRACHHGPQQRAPCSECHTAGSLGQLAARTSNPTFVHSRHSSVACTDCHGPTGAPGGLTLAANTGCLACHHGAQQRTPCATCHATNALDQRTMPVTFAISARRDPVTRPLVFAHARHTGLACARCHANDEKRSPPATCIGCHADHHTAASDCASCHTTARAGHDRTAHEGCAHCHTDARVAALQTSRPVCLACHQEQRNHYPTGDCATCHAVTGRDPARPGSGSGR